MKAAILLIDPHPGSRDSLGRLLGAEGCDVTVASNGQEALNALRTHGFDLVLVDFEMTASNGWEVLGHLITNSLSLPLIVIASATDHQHLSKRKGIAAAVAKPVELAVLIGVMEQALADFTENRSRGPQSESI